MATHSSILIWRIPRSEEPGGLQSIRSQSQTRLKRLSTHAQLKMHDKDSVCLCAKSFQLCPTLCDPMDRSLPGSFVHGILQARVLEWVVVFFSRGYCQPRGWICLSYVSFTGRWFFTTSTTTSKKASKHNANQWVFTPGLFPVIAGEKYFLFVVTSKKLGLSCGSVVKNPTANAGDAGWIHGWERSPGEGNRNPLQYFHLGNPIDSGAWWATVHGVQKSQTRLSD